MRVLVTNDDGPPDSATSPYIANFVATLKRLTDWEVTIAIPRQQRSWIGKAHIIGGDIDGEVHKFEETGDQEWILLDGTPASCANIGVSHHGPIDLVISGPNYGRNTSAAYIMSSGTVGAAAEGAICGTRSVALSYSYTELNHREEIITRASEISVRIVQHLWKDWHTDVQIYSVNVPLFDGLSTKTPIRYTSILQNVWNSVFSRDSEKDHRYLWRPDYARCDETVYEAGPGSDAWTVLHNEISISPIRAVFQNIDVGHSEIKLDE